MTSCREKVVTISVHSHGRGSDVCGDVEIRYPKVLSLKKKRYAQSLDLFNKYDVSILFNSLYCAVASANKLNLNLFVLEDCTNAGVKRRSSKHGCHWVGQVYDLPKYGSKILLCTKKRNLNDGSVLHV